MITVTINSVPLRFETDPSLFSPSQADRGTLAMLELCPVHEDDRVLDLGCGYGTVGIYASKIVGPANVTMTDISETAAACARKNAILNLSGEDASLPEIITGDGLKGITRRDYTVIYSNPPYHTDFSVARSFIEDGFRHLCVGGRMIMVTKRRTWYEKKLTGVFGGVKVTEKDGYFIFESEKRSAAKPQRSNKDKSKMSKKLARKYSARQS